MATTTTKDGKFSRVWAAVPLLVWTCNDCGALVAESARGLHLRWHVAQAALAKSVADAARAKRGFGT